MRKLLLIVAILPLFIACNNSHQSKPDADRVIKDTLAQSILKAFNDKPVTQPIYAQVETQEDKFSSVSDVMIEKALTSMKRKPQHFVINNNVSAEVKGQEGTKLSFKPHCFVTNNGAEISSAVDIELKELYTVSDMLNENLSNTVGFTANESKGAIYVNASADGQDLALRPGEKIGVTFPFKMKNSEGYRFFYGSEDREGLVEWRPLGEENSAQTADEPGFEANQICKPELNNNGLGLSYYLSAATKYPDEAKRNELSARIEVSFNVNERGRVANINVGESYKTFREEIERVLATMPNWKPASYQGKNISTLVKFDVDFNIRRHEQVRIIFNEEELALEQTDNTYYVLYGTDRKNEDGFFRTFGELGWYSAERTVGNANAAKADLIVGSDAKTEVKVVLKNKKSVSRGQHYQGYTRFKDIAEGAEVYVVAVRMDKDGLYYAIQPLKLKKQNVVTLAWIKASEQEVKKAWKKLV